MKISYSNFYKLIIILATVLSLDYLRILPINFGEFNIRFVVAIIGIVLSLMTLIGTKDDIYYKSNILLARKYGLVLLVSVLISGVISIFSLDYGLKDIAKVFAPYCYFFYVFPLIYIFTKQKSLRFLSTVSKIVMFMLSLKMVIWYLYNFHGVIFLDNLIFKYGSWSRGNFQRIETGCLFGVTFVIYMFSCISKKNKFLPTIAVVIMTLYVTFIAQSRLQLISIVATFMISLFLFNQGKNKKILFRGIILISILLFFLGGFASEFINTFSTNSTSYGGSTYTRIASLMHYWQLIKSQGAICGLGLLDTSIKSATNLMDNTYFPIGNWYKWYYIDDIGILGEFVRFGIMAVFVYGLLFIYAAKTSIKCYRESKTYECQILFGITLYMIISCIGLNVFDPQRAFDVPFYIAVISYMNGCLSKGELSEIAYVHHRIK